MSSGSQVYDFSEKLAVSLPTDLNCSRPGSKVKMAAECGPEDGFTRSGRVRRDGRTGRLAERRHRG